MKIGGVTISGPSEEVLVLPRLDGDIVIRARAVNDMEEFNRLFPEPKPRKILKAGGWEEDREQPEYKKAMEEYGTARWQYIVLKSLEPSEIEWDEVKLEDPGTWSKWEQEFVKAGLSNVEVNRITVCVMQANALDDRKLAQARDSFLRGQGAEVQKSSGQDTEQSNTPSGEPASDSESSPQE